MPRGKGKQRLSSAPVPTDVNDAYPRLDHRVNPHRPRDRFTVLSHFGDCMTVHGNVRDLEEAERTVAWARSQDPRYNAIDFAVHPIGAPMVLPLSRMAGQSPERRYHEANRDLQRMWDDRRAQLAKEDAEMRERVRTAMPEGGEIQLVGATPEGRLIDETFRAERATTDVAVDLPALPAPAAEGGAEAEGGADGAGAEAEGEPDV